MFEHKPSQQKLAPHQSSGSRSSGTKPSSAKPAKSKLAEVGAHPGARATAAVHSTVEQELPLSLLAEEQLEQLDALITAAVNSDPAGQDTDIWLVLGYLTAQGLQTASAAPQVWLQQLFDAPLAPEVAEPLLLLCQQLVATAQQGFYQGAGIELPFELDLTSYAAEVESWCAGFMHAVFTEEELWFGTQEQEIAELLVPLMVLSNLFVEEEDFAELAEDTALQEQMLAQLPDLLLDLYCQLHAPAEKPRRV